MHSNSRRTCNSRVFCFSAKFACDFSPLRHKYAFGGGVGGASRCARTFGSVHVFFVCVWCSSSCLPTQRELCARTHITCTHIARPIIARWQYAAL